MSRQTASHHEIYFPYVFSQHPHFILKPFRPGDASGMNFNTERTGGSWDQWPALCDVQARNASLFHPAKTRCCAGPLFVEALQQKASASPNPPRGRYKPLAGDCSGRALNPAAALELSTRKECERACDLCRHVTAQEKSARSALDAPLTPRHASCTGFFFMRGVGCLLTSTESSSSSTADARVPHSTPSGPIRCYTLAWGAMNSTPPPPTHDERDPLSSSRERTRTDSRRVSFPVAPRSKSIRFPAAWKAVAARQRSLDAAAKPRANLSDAK